MGGRPLDGGPAATPLNLKQAAARLGVHYMTAYRYVRTGQLHAEKVGTAWVVPSDAVERFLGPDHPTADGDRAAGDGDRRAADWSGRLAAALEAGDEPGAWRVVQRALASGHSPAECYLDVLTGALHQISSGHHDSSGTAPPSPGEFLATATATRLVARLGARFRRPGRTRGTVVFGAPLGEHHSLPIAIVADLLRMEGFGCLELGADVPPEVFASTAAAEPRLLVVGIGATTVAPLESLASTVDAVRARCPDTPILLGGQAVLNPEVAGLAGATHWAADGAAAVQVVSGLARARRPTLAG